MRAASCIRRVALHAALPIVLAVAAPQGAWAQAKEPDVHLLKVVTTKDETVIGVTREDVDRRGGGAALDSFAKAVAEAGHLVVWQYAVKRAGRDNEYGAFRRIAIFKDAIVRIEPVTTEYEIQPPPK